MDLLSGDYRFTCAERTDQLCDGDDIDKLKYVRFPDDVNKHHPGTLVFVPYGGQHHASVRLSHDGDLLVSAGHLITGKMRNFA